MTFLTSSSGFHSPVAAGWRSSHSCGGHGAWLAASVHYSEYNWLWDMMRTLMLKGIRQTKQMPLRPQPCILLVANYLPPLRDAIPHPSVLLHTPSSTKIKAYRKSSLFWGDWADWTARITSLLHVMRVVDCGCRLSPTYHQNWVNSNSGNYSALARHLPYWQEAALPCSAGDSLLIEEYLKLQCFHRETLHTLLFIHTSD